MEQAKQLNDAVKALGSLQDVLGGIDLSQLKVAIKIKGKIANLKSELEQDIRDHEFFVNYDIDTKPEEILEMDSDFEERLFKEALETLSWGGSIADLDMYSVEQVIDDTNDLGRTIRNARREISRLEDLLK